MKEEKLNNFIIILFWLKTDNSIFDVNQYQKVALIKMNNKIIILSKKINNNDNHEVENSLLSLLNIKKNKLYFF